MRTLLLNASMEPLTTVSWKRALVLLMEERADLIYESTESVHSTSGEVALPSVIRLRNYVKVPYDRRIPLNRRAVLARDGHTCQFTHCNERATTIDHVHPRSKGGPHAWTNVVGACKKCNFRKADIPMDELAQPGTEHLLDKARRPLHPWKLKKQPKEPRGRFLLFGSAPDERWYEFLEAA